jgi:hypothetical protein
MVGELKKGRYVYYHCTGNKGRCGDPYVREEQLMSELARGLSQLAITPDTLAWIECAVGESDKTEAGAREQALMQLKAVRDRLQQPIEMMYVDRLDGRISVAFFDEKSTEWREQQKQVEARMAQLATTELRSATEAVQIIRSVSDACGSFQERQPQQQRTIATALTEKATWKAGKFEWLPKSPFQMLAHSNSVSQTKEGRNRVQGRKLKFGSPRRTLFINGDGDFRGRIRQILRQRRMSDPKPAQTWQPKELAARGGVR